MSLYLAGATNIFDMFNRLPDFLWNCLLISVAIITGLVLKRLISFLIKSLTRKNNNHNFIVIVLKRLGAPINLFLPVVISNSFLPFMRLIPIHAHYMDKAIENAFYISFAFILIRCVQLFEDYVELYFNLEKKDKDNIRDRKVRTQLQFIRKLLILIIVTLTIALVLLSFESLRKLGAGLLTGVGVGGIIIGFAAQRSLGNLLAGFQIAFTQPIRIDDIVVVEGEYGRVDDITLTYVVLKIWDERNLILPITYFVEKPFQNWTRLSSDITGTVFIQIDYTIPVEEIRAYFYASLEDNILWDRRKKNLQVTDIKERTLELRALMSAANASNLWDLRCQMREMLINYIQLTYPESLPQIRLPQVRLGENTEIGVTRRDLIDSRHKGGST